MSPFRRFCVERDLLWLYRPHCWLRRYHQPHGSDVYFEVCMRCGRLLWSRSRDGSPNPLKLAGRCTLGRRPTPA